MVFTHPKIIEADTTGGLRPEREPEEIICPVCKAKDVETLYVTERYSDILGCENCVVMVYPREWDYDALEEAGLV